MDGILQDTNDLLGSTHNLMEGFVHFCRNPWVWLAKNTVHTGKKTFYVVQCMKEMGFYIIFSSPVSF